MENQFENFETFYVTKLKPQLDKLEPKSNDISKWTIAGFASLFLCIACFVIDEPVAAVIFIILIIISIYNYTRKSEDYVYNYKETIIKEIIEYLNPGAIYKPLGMISPIDYEKSGLFPRKYDSYQGEDWINGTYKNVTYYCSELETFRIGSGRSRYEKGIFRGLFFVAPIRNTYSATYVWPANDVRLPVSIADYHFERFLPLPEISPVDMGNSEFENYFAVYSNDGATARSLINDSMMHRMIGFRQQIQRDVRFSFVEGICFVAIAVNNDLLEPSVSDPLNKENVKEYFFSVLLILSIINQLDLKSLV